MWANKGQDFVDFPECGRWKIAEDLFASDEKYSLLFYNFGTVDEPKIVNPFWKEIGTDLVKEIKDGKAFQGSAFKEMNFNIDPLKQKKEALQSLASVILSNSSAANVETEVRKLFTGYLELMHPMHIATNSDTMTEPLRYRVYARSIPVLKTGFVVGTISDWDQPIYKSSNTALLHKEATGFVGLQGGKQIGGGKAIIVHSDEVKDTSENATFVLAGMLKAQRQSNDSQVYTLGREFLDRVKISQSQHNFFDQTQHLQKIKILVKKYQPHTVTKGNHTYPYELNTFVSRDKITGPRVAQAVQKIREQNGCEAALEVAEKFLAWCAFNHKHFNVKDLKAMLPNLRQEVDGLASLATISEEALENRVVGIKIREELQRLRNSDMASHDQKISR
jgi:hypothetical protein